jgi:hypothetical protein
MCLVQKVSVLPRPTKPGFFIVVQAQDIQHLTLLSGLQANGINTLVINNSILLKEFFNILQMLLLYGVVPIF